MRSQKWTSVVRWGAGGDGEWRALNLTDLAGMSNGRRGDGILQLRNLLTKWLHTGVNQLGGRCHSRGDHPLTQLVLRSLGGGIIRQTVPTSYAVTTPASLDAACRIGNVAHGAQSSSCDATTCPCLKGYACAPLL